MRINHVRQRLASGEPSIGTWLSLPSPEAAEYISRLPFDWLVVDAEHNPVDIRTLAQMFAAMSTAGIAPMVLLGEGPRSPKRRSRFIRISCKIRQWRRQCHWCMDMHHRDTVMS